MNPELVPYLWLGGAVVFCIGIVAICEIALCGVRQAVSRRP